MAKPPEAQLVLSDGEQLTPVAPGQAVPLEQPPQGGYVIYTTVKLRNVWEGSVTFRGRVRDVDSGNVVAFDGRSANITLGADGWGAPDAIYADVTNVNPCPDFGVKDIQRGNWLLEVIAVDSQGRMATASQPVVPECMQSNDLFRANCVCTCSAGYYFGKCGFGNNDGGPHD
jgi:hypothetical protein